MEIQWFTSRDTWYEDFFMFAPSTNNACEAINRTIKDEHTFRERLPMSTFKEIMMKMVNTWSKAYQGEKKLIEIPTIELKTWTEAYNWNKAAKGIITLEEDNNFKYYANSSRAPQNNDIQSGIQPKWNTFDQFKRRAFNIWCIELPKEAQSGLKVPALAPDS